MQSNYNNSYLFLLSNIILRGEVSHKNTWWQTRKALTSLTSDSVFNYHSQPVTHRIELHFCISLVLQVAVCTNQLCVIFGYWSWLILKPTSAFDDSFHYPDLALLWCRRLGCSRGALHWCRSIVAFTAFKAPWRHHMQYFLILKNPDWYT